jgi:enamine deaminase RidA (YjgF/YER057c/UK114 family)
MNRFFFTAAVFGAILVAIIVWYHHAAAERGQIPVTLMIVALGSSIGVLAGALTSPFRRESTTFEKLTGLVAAFFSGYVLSELGPLMAAVFEQGVLFTKPDYGFRLSAGVVAAVVAGVLTYAYRTYESPNSWFKSEPNQAAQLGLRDHRHPHGLPPPNGYSHAVVFSGRMIVVSGQVPLDERGELVGRDDPRAQMKQVFENLTRALAAAGAGMEHVVKLTVFLTDLADLGVFRSVRDEYVSAERPPASSLVEVGGLVNPEFRVEIEALAAL